MTSATALSLVSTIDQLQGLEGSYFVPTMGALHAGHGALVRQARAMAEASGLGEQRPKVSVSIFVNPTQFNDSSDLSRYPRTLKADLALCREAGADFVFAPSVEVMYPQGLKAGTIAVPPAGSQPRLEDAFRPGHFEGVCQVVYRLFELVKPRAALFGEKDYQQLAVIRQMTTRMKLPVAIVPCVTIREHDGLAMSSRNRFLTSTERQQAPAMYRAMVAASRETSPVAAEAMMKAQIEQAGMLVEYTVVRDAQTLLPMGAGGEIKPGAGRMIVAARLGSVRLIDNMSWPA
jgi:pantoate--beta-alanine ligase